MASMNYFLIVHPDLFSNNLLTESEVRDYFHVITPINVKLL
jgi:hypothetical protein